MNPQPVYNQLPTPTGGYQLYQPANKLLNKKALITGGDSGIGRSVAVLYAMEGADSAIVYLPGEESDAQETKRLVEGYGRKCILLPTDLTVAENCKRVIAQTVEALGGLNILVNNAGTQLAQESITDISDEQWDFTFKSNIYSMFYLSKYSFVIPNSPLAHHSSLRSLCVCTQLTPPRVVGSRTSPPATQSSTTAPSTTTSASPTFSTTPPPRAPSSPSHARYPTSYAAKASASTPSPRGPSGRRWWCRP